MDPFFNHLQRQYTLLTHLGQTDTQTNKPLHVQGLLRFLRSCDLIKVCQIPGEASVKILKQK